MYLFIFILFFALWPVHPGLDSFENKGLSFMRRFVPFSALKASAKKRWKNARNEILLVQYTAIISCF